MIKKLKKWNWSLFFVVVLLCEIGLLSNKMNLPIEFTLIITGIFAVVIGIPLAWLTREN